MEALDLFIVMILFLLFFSFVGYDVYDLRMSVVVVFALYLFSCE